MEYLLITGATGLVGRYLLRDLLAQGCRIVVIVRPTRLQSARQRIESIMRQRESEQGYALPRPVVLAGDLTRESLGLDEAQVGWLRANCHAVLHSAASLSFSEDPKTGEPFRTNVGGMRHLLELCRRSDIRQFHHVSTAYVCGLREGRIGESEVDVGQQTSNPYEASKLQAEKLVRDADFLDCLTVYRPSSVLGDSVTGYTSTTHGFYLPLQLAYSTVNRLPVNFIDDRFIECLGLKGHERQNMVPVDWLAATIAYLVLQPSLRGKTYHLTHPHATSVRVMLDVIQEVIGECTDVKAPVATESFLVEVIKQFSGQMDTYRSYFRDDPEFDRTNTEAAVGHIPLVEVDHDLLVRMSRYPIRHKFAPRRDFDQGTHFIADELATCCGKPIADPSFVVPQQDGAIGLQINGAGGGQWKIVTSGGRNVEIEDGLPENSADLIYFNTHTYERLVQGAITVQQAIASAQVVIEYGRPADSPQEAPVRHLEQLFGIVRQQRSEHLAAELIDKQTSEVRHDSSVLPETHSPIQGDVATARNALVDRSPS